MSHKILRITTVQERIGLGRSTIYDLMAKGAFPLPIKLGERAVGWIEVDIDNWLSDRASVQEGNK